MKKYFSLLICFAGILFLLSGCDSKKDTGMSPRLAELKVLRESTADSSSAETFFISRAADFFDTKLKTTDTDAEYTVRFVRDAETARSLDLPFPVASSSAFQIESRDNRLYFIAPTEEALIRAADYFLWHFLDKDDSLLLWETSYYDSGSQMKDSVWIGSTPIGEYRIVYADANSQDLYHAAGELASFILQTSGDSLEILSAKDDEQNRCIQLSVDDTLTPGEHRIRIQDKNIYISGSDTSSVQKGVYVFLNTYLGWMYAGEENARISAVAHSLTVPDHVPTQTPWMDEREAIVTLWNVHFPRGFFYNDSTSLKSDIMSYSEEQLYEYVKMLKICGFTGIQVTDMVSAWAGSGGHEYVHERIRTMADAAHSMDMRFTLWVWGAEFDGYSWVDQTVTYSPGDYDYAHQNPDVLAVFEKYYSIYAELADCCDRVIAHYYDPGGLEFSEDVAYFADMLRSKFLAVNPDIDFGVSCWVDTFDKNAFIQALGNDITLYEGCYRDDPEGYRDFRTYVNNSGCRLGTWAWNTCEMEIDQMAQMNFNPDIIRETYQTARQYDTVMPSSYWSEMDSYHVLNVFSLYCAGHLLVDPDMDGELLLQELAEKAVGIEYADDFIQILLLIQDARSGNTWSTYWWNSENYILKSDSYPAEDILERCNIYIPLLQEMIDTGVENTGLPLPVSMQDVLKLILPHLQQIKAFAEFRMNLAEVEAACAQGASTEELSSSIAAISIPIPEYNCIIGAWGQIEARAQWEMIYDFCNRTGVPMPQNAAYDALRKSRIYDYFVSSQKGHDYPVIQYFPYYQFGLAYGEDTYRMVYELVAEGLLTMDENTGVYVTNWQDYRYHFN